MSALTKDDRILPLTRVVAVLVIPFLVLAFVILFFFPHLSGKHFSWEIKPSLMAVYMGSGYLGGSFLFFQTALGKKWHHVAGGYLAVTSFTIMMLITTILHWQRFDLGHFPFQLWLLLYIVTPVLVPWLWWRNRKTDPVILEPGDIEIPKSIRIGVRLLGGVIMIISLVGFLLPGFIIQIWPWTLTPLLARVLAGWGTLLAVGNLVIGGEKRWSAWRVLVASIAIWHLLYLIGSIIYRQEFIGATWLNWFNLSVIAILVLVSVFYIRMERSRRQAGSLAGR